MSAELVSRLPAAQRLSLAYCPARSRAPTLALLALDERLSAAIRGRREPIASQMRLAWWRDLLARPPDSWPPGEPVIAAMRGWGDAQSLRPLVDGWEALLSETFAPSVVAEFVDGRVQAFAALARELGVDAVDAAAAAARVWALADLAANLSAATERELVVELARGLAPPPRLPAALRPLAVLAGLGAAALARGGGALLGGPASAFHALRIGLTGR
jgi:phytoene synthase